MRQVSTVGEGGQPSQENYLPILALAVSINLGSSEKPAGKYLYLQNSADGCAATTSQTQLLTLRESSGSKNKKWLWLISQVQITVIIHKF